jgi:hypothetical protein
VQVHTYRVPSEPDQPHWRFLCSDLHLGSPNVAVKRLKGDLDLARQANARIWINGDVFDAISRTDKRSDAAVLVPELRGKKDLLQSTVVYAAGILEPYADLIDWIGIGNHEETWVKWHEFDPVAGLIGSLNSTLARQGSAHQIRHGGICGWVRTWFDVAFGTAACPAAHTTYYFHGAGGDSPVTLGTIDMNRKEVAFHCDLLWFGHKHNRLVKDSVQLELSQTGIVRERHRKAIQTGSYYRNYAQQGQANALDYSYAESHHAAPKSLGGRFLVLTPVRGYVAREGRRSRSSLIHVRMDDASRPIAHTPLGAA